MELKFLAVAGVHYRFSPDFNSVTLISALDDGGSDKQRVFYVSWMKAHPRLEYARLVADQPYERAPTADASRRQNEESLRVCCRAPPTNLTAYEGIPRLAAREASPVS